MTLTISLDQPLTQTYIVHSALLALKLLALSPVAAMTWVDKGLFSNPIMVRKAFLTDLKHLAPFWVLGALYITTNPPERLGICLFRLYTLSRLIVILGYMAKPLPAFLTDSALIASYFITCYMGVAVIVYHRKGL